MSDNQNQLAVSQPKRASDSLALLMGMEPRAMLDTIKAQCFKNSRPDQISDAQLAAFVSIANDMGVNPLLPGMLYAYPSQGAIVPMMGPDGVYKKLTEHPQVDSWETVVYPEDVTQPATHAVTKIWRKGTERPLSYTALLSEWKVNSNPNWSSRTRHMLGLRSLKQCARQVIHGIPFDEDERQIMEAINVTGTAEPAVVPDRPAPKPRSPKGAAIVKENATAKEVVINAETVATVETPSTVTVNPLHAEGNAIIAEANAKVAATTPPPTPASTQQAKPVEPAKTVQSFADAAKATTASKARTSLNAGEVITVEAQVEEFAEHPGIKDGKEIKYVKARITSPEYVGEVSDLSRSPLWTLDDGLRLTLRGNGKRVFVDAVKNLTEAAPDTATKPDEF